MRGVQKKPYERNEKDSACKNCRGLEKEHDTFLFIAVEEKPERLVAKEKAHHSRREHEKRKHEDWNHDTFHMVYRFRRVEHGESNNNDICRGRERVHKRIFSHIIFNFNTYKKVPHEEQRTERHP
jgi:hypothetical protein